MGKRGLFSLFGMLLTAGAHAQEFVPDWLQADGLENGPVSAYRITELRLRDPHVFVSAVGCRDFTDNDLPLLPGSAFNSQLNAPLNSDSDNDGFLDSSTLLLFRPLDLSGRIQRSDTVAARCTAPLPTQACAVEAGSQPGISSYVTLQTGVCQAPISGTLGSPAYNPAVATVSARCIAARTAGGAFSGGGVSLPLQSLRISAGVQSNPDRLTPGMLRGFLRRSDADAILLPPATPLVGGQPFSILLPGGTGNCSSRNDLDMLDGEPGWWMYFFVSAEPVPFTETQLGPGRVVAKPSIQLLLP